MKRKKLTREQAIRHYWVYQLKTLELVDLFVVLLEAWKRKDEKHPYFRDRTYRDIGNTIELAVVGWLAQLFEKSADSLNIVDLWLALFPADGPRIRSFWGEIKPETELMRKVRNQTAFHASESPAEHIKARSALIANRGRIYRAIGLAINFYVTMMENALKDVGADFNAFSRGIAEQSKAAFEAASRQFQELNRAAGGLPVDPLTNTSAFDIPI